MIIFISHRVAGDFHRPVRVTVREAVLCGGTGKGERLPNWHLILPQTANVHKHNFKTIRPLRTMRCLPFVFFRENHCDTQLLARAAHHYCSVYRSTQPSTLRGPVKWVPASWVSNNAWRWANVRLSSLYRRTQRFEAWPTSWRTPGANRLSLRGPKLNSRILRRRRQHCEYLRGVIIIIIIIIIINVSRGNYTG